MGLCVSGRDDRTEIDLLLTSSDSGTEIVRISLRSGRCHRSYEGWGGALGVSWRVDTKVVWLDVGRSVDVESEQGTFGGGVWNGGE